MDRTFEIFASKGCRGVSRKRLVCTRLDVTSGVRVLVAILMFQNANARPQKSVALSLNDDVWSAVNEFISSRTTLANKDWTYLPLRAGARLVGNIWFQTRVSRPRSKGLRWGVLAWLVLAESSYTCTSRTKV